MKDLPRKKTGKKRGLRCEKVVFTLKNWIRPIFALATLVGPPAACDAYEKKTEKRFASSMSVATPPPLPLFMNNTTPSRSKQKKPISISPSIYIHSCIFIYYVFIYIHMHTDIRTKRCIRKERDEAGFLWLAILVGPSGACEA